MSLQILAYDLKRMITIFGPGPLARLETDRVAQATRVDQSPGATTA
jgi:hypothetical protein